MCFFLNWLVSEQLAKSACASITSARSSLRDLAPLQPLPALGTPSLEQGGAGCLSWRGGSPGPQAPRSQASASPHFRCLWSPTPELTPTVPAPIPPAQDGPAGQSAGLGQAQGLHSCWLIRHLLTDALGDPVTSAFTAPRRGVQ